MSECGWRTLVIKKKCELRLNNGLVSIITDDAESSVPIDQIARVVVAVQSCVLSAALINALSERSVSIVFCDDKYEPASEVVNLGLHTNAAGVLMDQINWAQERRDEVWQYIIKAKISMQAKLLAMYDLVPVVPLEEYAADIQAGDPTNREAMAARVYFSVLFGHGFHRNAVNEINSALNYGYAIICSSFSRVLAMHGYNISIGIHHRSRNNRFNLPCDLMEPFRPFVDRFVFENIDRELDWGYKKDLIELPYHMAEYGGMRMSIDTIIENYSLSVMRTMETGVNHIKELNFCITDTV